MLSNEIKILAVDDDPEGLYALETLLKQNGFVPISASSAEEAIEKAARESPELILLDVNLPGIDGYEATRKLKADPELRYIPIVLLTAKSALEDIVHGLAQGADGYVIKPYRHDELVSRIKAALRTRALYLELQSSYATNASLRDLVVSRASYADIIGKSAAMQRIYDLIEKIKVSDVPVLITGESGTGKELVARAVHFSSLKKSKNFLALNCSAFNENLLESELFGYVRGAFSGAVRDKQGLFEAADGGTLFLDELGEMPLPLQAKLLRVLQDGTFIPVGSVTPKKVDVRIVAATNRNLQQMIEAEKFRKDLFYRINVISLNLPALRDRPEDIALLADYFLSSQAKGAHKKQLSQEALSYLMTYEWPGNIRELENEISRLVLLSADCGEIQADLLSPHIVTGTATMSAHHNVSEANGSLKEALESVEREMIRKALVESHGNKSKAAEKLGVSRTSLIKKVQLFKLE